jgi:hypothetical protein
VKVDVEVREREYEIGEKGTPVNVLKTGFLLPCVAFYGINPDRGLVFVCHIDCHARGISRIVRDLDVRTGGDRRGFDVYVTSGLNPIERIAAGFLFVWFIEHICQHSPLLAGIAYVGLAYCLFGPMLFGYAQLWWYFRTLARPRFLWGFGRRVEVTVDTSKRVPDHPSFERGNAATISKAKFGFRKESCALAPINRATDMLAAAEAIERRRQSIGVPPL